MRFYSTLCLMLALPLIGHSAILYVPGDHPTIQKAIDTASNGDTIFVSPGTYVENLDLLDKAITLTSSDGADKTVIDGNQIAVVVTGFNSGSIIDGFTITNGYNNFGAGIHCESSSPVIKNNIIRDNSSSGICCMKNAHPLIEHNVILDNTANFGAGIFCYLGSSPTIKNNIITSNYAFNNGGGIYGERESSPIIIHNYICGNKASVGGGITIYAALPITVEPVIINNILCDNEADRGGGIATFDCLSEISGNTIVSNKAILEGGGIFCGDESDLSVIDTIIWNNSAGSGPQITVGNIYGPSDLTISYSDVERGQPAVQIAAGCTLTWNQGMIDADPVFADQGNHDFHLTYLSPCRDTGDNSGVSVLDDFEGDPRIAYGTVDMGADEFHPHLYLTGDTTPTGNVEIKFIGLPGHLINGLLIGVNLFDPPLPCDYGLWYMDNPFQIMTGFGSIPVDGIKVFPGTIPGSTPSPMTVYLQAAIDYQLTNLCRVKVK